MAATDYVIVTGWMNAYRTKKKKPTKKGPQTMSEDRRTITDCGGSFEKLAEWELIR